MGSRLATWSAAVIAAATAMVPLGATEADASVASGATFACPPGFNLCIPAQGANEGVVAGPGQVIPAGYDFTAPSSLGTIIVQGAYEQLSVTCEDGAPPTRSTVVIPMPDAEFTLAGHAGWIPTGDQADRASYEGSLVAPDLCAGGPMRIGQPGQMLFAARVYATNPGTASVSFRSHYNDAAFGRSGSWSATKGVVPAPWANSSE